MSIFNCIIHQVIHHPAKLIFTAHHCRQIWLHLVGEAHTSFLSAHVKSLVNFGDDCIQVDQAALAGVQSSLNPRNVEQVIHHTAQPVHLALDFSQEPLGNGWVFQSTVAQRLDA